MPALARWTPKAPQAKLLGRRRRSGKGAVRWPFLAYAAAVVCLSYSRRRLGLPRHPMVPVVSTAPLAVAAGLPPGKRQYAAVWASYVWLFKVAWEIPYDRPDKLRERLRVRYPIRFDSLIAAGAPPSLRLQRALRDPSRLTRLDKALTVAHYGLWLVPHGVLAWLLWRHEQHFPRAAGRLAGVYHLTTVGYWLIPTAPPWWASEEEGEMEGRVAHVTSEVDRALKARLRRLRGAGEDGGGEDRAQSGGNPWGSMPSDHLASAAITAICMGEVGPKAGALGWTYAVLLGFILVYLGEHYVIDLIAGLAVAGVVWGAGPAVEPFVRGGVAALRALEWVAS